MAKLSPKQAAKKLETKRKRLQNLLVSALNKTLPLVKRVVQRQNLSGPTGSNSVRRQSGTLKKSIVFTRAQLARTFLGRATAVATFSITAPHAKVHIGKRGKRTVIKPSRAKFLAIPTKFARDRRGVPIAGPRDPRWGRTFVANDIIFGTRKGKTARSVRPLFVLKKRVVVPQRVDTKRDITVVAQGIYNSKVRQGLAKIL